MTLALAFVRAILYLDSQGKESQEEFPPGSLSCLLAQRVCFESAQKEVSPESDLCNRAFHNLGMISLGLFEIEEAIKFFTKSTLEASENGLAKLRELEKEYQLYGAVNTYKQEIIYRYLISDNTIHTKVTRREAEFFKFSEEELKDIFKMADQILGSIKTDQGAVLLPIGRSPFWITEAIKLLSLPQSLKIIPLSFSQSKYNEPQKNEFLPPQLKGYITYLKEHLAEVNSTDHIYILDYCSVGLTAMQMGRMLDAYYPPPPGKSSPGEIEPSIIKERIHLIALRNSSLSLPAVYTTASHSDLLQLYSSVMDIELPPSLKYLLIQKNPFYKFLEMPYLGFYPKDWENYMANGEPNKTIIVNSEIPTVRLEQIKSFRDKEYKLLHKEKNS